MSRWHELYCTSPDVKICGGLPCCAYCFAIASIDDRESSNGEDGPEFPAGSKYPRVGLTWPASVEYIQPSSPTRNTASEKDEEKRYPERQNDSVGSKQLRQSAEPLLGKLKPSRARAQPAPGYTKLHHPSHIRLLQVASGTQEDPVHADFSDSRLDQNHTEFDALSYTWADETGDTRRCRPIFIGPYWDVYLATRNCEKAIRSVRRIHWTCCIWVDSICINQEDDYERSVQVGLMSRIYANADRVLVYVGDLSTDGGAALDRLVRKDFMHIFSQASTSESKPYHIEVCECVPCVREKQALKSFFSRPYFQRLWVVQELVLAKSAWIYCGSRSIPWPMSGLKDLKETQECPRWIRYRDTRARFASKHLLSLLVDTSTCRCADPRDRVFALLGLIQSWDEEPILPDYSLGVIDVYIGIAAYLITKCGAGRDVLSYAEGQGEQQRLPSWVPNWSNSLQRSGFDLHQWGLELIPNLGTPLKYKTNRVSNVGITHRDAALLLEGTRLGKVIDLFSRDPKKEYWKTIIEPISGGMRLLMTCPLKRFTSDDHLFWLHGMNTFAILRLADKQSDNHYRLLCVCEILAERRYEPLASDGFFITINEFSGSEEEAVRELDYKLISSIHSELSPQLLRTSHSFMSSLRRVVDASYCLDRGEFGLAELLLDKWLKMRQSRGWMLEDESVLRDLMRLIRNLIEEDSNELQNPSYLYDGQKMGTLENFNQLLWSFMKRNTEQTCLDKVSNSLPEDPSKLFKQLKEWADLTGELMKAFSQSSLAMCESWGDLLPGSNLHRDWEEKYVSFQEYIASKSGLVVKEAISKRVMAISTLEVLQLQNKKAIISEGIVADLFPSTKCIWSWSALQEATTQRKDLWQCLREEHNMRLWLIRDSTGLLEEDMSELPDGRNYMGDETGYSHHFGNQMMARLELRHFNINIDDIEKIAIV